MRLFYIITSKNDSMWRLVKVLRVAQVAVEHIVSTYISMHANVIKHSYMDFHASIF